MQKPTKTCFLYTSTAFSHEHVVHYLTQKYALPHVDAIHCAQQTPTLPQLQQYQVVFVCCVTSPFFNVEQMATVLNQYVEQNCGNVICSLWTFYNDERSRTSGFGLHKFLYLPFVNWTSNYLSGGKTSQVHVPQQYMHHPLFTDIPEFKMKQCTSGYLKTQLASNAQVCAMYSDDNCLAAEIKIPSTNKMVLALNCLPYSNTNQDDWYDINVQERLIYNAICYVYSSSLVHEWRTKLQRNSKFCNIKFLFA